MAVTDLTGDSGDYNQWLQSLYGRLYGGSLMASPGAAQPYSAAIPGGYPGTNAQGAMPGGGLKGYSAASAGAPSMGYPSLYNAPVAPVQPSPGMNPQTGATTAGMTLNSSSPYSWGGVNNWLQGLLHPGASRASVPLGQGGIGSDARIPTAGGGGGFLPDPANSAWLGDTGGYMPSLPSLGPAGTATAAPSGPARPTGYGGIGGDWRYPMTNASMAAQPYGPPQGAGAYGNMPYPGQIDPRGVWAPGPTGGVRRGGATSAAPGAGAPTGSPSQTPRPARAAGGGQNPRFPTFTYNVPGAPRNAPVYTAFNLFGGQ